MRIAFVIGYFDPFSGYQEVQLVEALSEAGHEVRVFAGNRVDEIFSEDALRRLGMPRCYEEKLQERGGYSVSRFEPAMHKRGMLWSNRVAAAIQEFGPTLVVCQKPGQVLSFAGMLVSAGVDKVARRAVIFDDNRAQYADLSPVGARLKRLLFYLSKGPLYAAFIRRADRVYTNTPNGRRIIAPLAFGRKSEVLPLSFNPAVFYQDEGLRRQTRGELGLRDDELLIASTGKVTAKKRVEVLFDSVRSLARLGRKIKLLIVGLDNSQYCQRIRQEASASEELRSRVILREFAPLSQLNAFANAADVGVWHRQPAISIQQAMGTGLFCVLPENDLVGHLLTSETGAYFRENDFAEMSRVFERLGANGMDALASNRAARARLNARFSRHEVAAQLLRTAMN